jgi:hypothetical protein
MPAVRCCVAQMAQMVVMMPVLVAMRDTIRVSVFIFVVVAASVVVHCRESKHGRFSFDCSCSRGFFV